MPCRHNGLRHPKQCPAHLFFSYLILHCITQQTFKK
ncbi:hypothetical protein [Pseudomonas carnis]